MKNLKMVVAITALGCIALNTPTTSPTKENWAHEKSFTNSANDYKYVRVDWQTTGRMLENKMQIIAYSNIPKTIRDQTGNQTSSPLIRMRMLFGHEIINGDESTISLKTLRERMKKIGVRFASYRETLSFIPQTNIPDKCRINVIARTTNDIGKTTNFVITIQIPRKGISTARVKPSSSRFGRRDAIAVVKE